MSWWSVDWRFGLLSVLGFCGVMLTRGITWRWRAAAL
jgi:hypothetical protein